MEIEDYRRIIQQLDDLIAVFEHHPDEATREQATALLSAIDMLHREAITRMAKALPAEALHDSVVETLLGLYGLVDLDLPDEPPPVAANTLWIDLADARELPPGSMRAASWEDLRLLLVNIGGEIYAFRNACSGSDLPLELGHLQGNELICPSHGCRYDARTGRRLDGGKGRLDVVPVTVRGNSIQIAVQRL